ncbi:MAG: N-6 DNA methylase [Acidimicrobiales bacterium]
MVDARGPIVARRAAELAVAASIDLPDDLALWGLAGGRPTVGPVPGDPEELGTLLEGALGALTRRRQGVHHTPRALAVSLVERAIGERARPVIGDPACGGGALLLAAARHLAHRGERPADIVQRLWGADIDPLAAATTEAALSLWAGAPPPPGHVHAADALVEELGWPRLDVVVGNPPFLSQLGATTTRRPADAARLRGRFGDAVRPYTDPASLFLLLACELAAPDGMVALVQPQSVLAARDAVGVREAITARADLDDVWFPEQPGFEAAVDVCVPFLRCGRSGDDARWSSHLARANGVPAVDLRSRRKVADEAIATAGFRGEYYGMVDHVHEVEDRPAAIPLVTTGLVDLGRVAWGERSARIGGRVWDRPVLDVAGLEGRASVWAQRTRGPKVVVATQTQVVEAVVDDDGAWIPAVPLVVLLAPVECLWPLASAVASPAVSAWLLARAAGAALTRRSLKVSAALLREVPLPSDADAWTAGTEAFRGGDLEGYVAAMAAAYGVGSHVGDWWIERARTVWSPVPVPR